MKKTKRIGLVLCALIIAASLLTMSGCGKPSLKGETIVWGNWWADYDTDTFEPQNENDEKTLEWRIKIEKDNGFKFIEKNVAGWGDFNGGFVPTSIMTGDPAASAFMMQPDWAMSVITQNLAYPVSDSKVVDFKNPQPVASGQRAPEFNAATHDTFNFGGKTYAFSLGVNLYNTQVIFYNKRLFREAGLDPNLPYDMQRDGTWTWENFINICKQLTRDTDGDGIYDTYAMCNGGSGEIAPALAASNGARFVGKDSNGLFYNATLEPAFIEAMQFMKRLNEEGVLKPEPAGANWDWYKAEFADGKVAFRIDESYVWGELGNLNDDWGVVLPPKGPRVNNYRVLTRENVVIIPATFKPAEVDKILYAFALWNTPQVPEDDWKNGMYHIFRDSRAVDETLVLIRDTSLHINKDWLLIPGFNIGNIAWQVWGYEGDPSQLIESQSATYNSLINDVNNQFN